MDNKELSALVQRAIDGEAGAFDALYFEKIKSIYYRVSQLVDGRQDVEDAAQDVILAMYQGIRRLRDPDLFNAWMHRIIVNRCNSMLRKRYAVKRMVPLEEIENVEAEDRAEFLPREFAEDNEKRRALLDIIETLPARRKEILLLFYFEDMSCAEIAGITGTALGTVTATLSQTKKSIAKQLEHRFGPLEVSGSAFAALPVLRMVMDYQAELLLDSDLQVRLLESCKLKPPAAEPVARAGAAPMIRAGIYALVLLAALAAGSLTWSASVKKVPDIVSYRVAEVPQPSETTGDGYVMDKGKPGQSMPQDDGEDSSISSSPAAKPAVTGRVVVKETSAVESDDQQIKESISGMTVRLYKDGVFAEQTATGSDGAFAFITHVQPGHQYTLALVLPPQCGLAATRDNPSGIVDFAADGRQTAFTLYVTALRPDAGSIELLDAACDCGHVNPALAVIDAGALGDTRDWQIVREADGAVLYSGDSIRIDTPFAELLEQKQEGLYLIRYRYTSETGAQMESRVVFRIYPGTISPHQFG